MKLLSGSSQAGEDMGALGDDASRFGGEDERDEAVGRWDARPHPATVRTLRYAAEIASSRYGGLAEAPAMLLRWEHEITVAIMRRRAAMTR